MKKVSAVKTTGGSMMPFMHGGSFVFIEHIPSSGFRPGDKVLYKYAGSVFIHRIKKINHKPALDGTTVESFEITDDASVILPHKIYPEEALGRPVSNLNGFTGLMAGKISNLVYGTFRKLKLYFLRPFSPSPLPAHIKDEEKELL